MLVFLVTLSVVVGVLFGVVPAIQSSRVDVNALMKGTSGERRRFGLGRALVIGQVAISLALLIGAGLYIRTLWNLRHAALGFNPDNVLVFRLAPKRGGYEGDKLLQLVERVSSGIEAVPGVRAVSYSHLGLLNRIQTSGGLRVAGEKLDQSKPSTLILYVSPAFFDATRISVTAGRALNDHDGAGAPRVGVANEALAREYFDSGSPLGRQVLYFMDKYKTPLEIVGEVKDAKYARVTDPMKPVLYLPYAQNLENVQEASFVVRTSGDPRTAASAVREVVRHIDPDLPVFGMTTETTLRDENLRDQRLMADLASAFAALAVLLAGIGLYGVISYSISRRTSEIGIRMALGADQRRVLREVLGESLALVSAGMVIGLGLAWGATRLIASQLYGLQPRDPSTAAAAAGLIVLITAAASFLPARRASRIDPMTALRHD